MNFVFLLLPVVNAQCSFQVPSVQSVQLTFDPIPAHDLSFFSPPSCPEFSHGPVCCTDFQNTLMHTAFHLIDLALGSVSGGCDVCAASLKRVWCHFVCSPHQSQYVSVVNTTSEQYLDFAVTPATAQSLFEVCKGTPLISLIPEMQTPLGFLQFQAQKSLDFSPVKIVIVETDSQPALKLAFEPCDTSATSLYGFQVTPCSCGVCEALCSDQVHRPLAFALTIADWLGVGFAYCCFAGFVVSLLLWLRRRRPDVKKAN